QAWLDELAALDIALADVRLYPIARSRADLRPCGVLAVASSIADLRVRLPAGAPPRAYPYQKIAGRLFVPADGQLWPPIDPSEIVQQLVGDISVWHPVAGLASFEAADALTVADLLQKPIERPTDWGHAMAGSAAAPRLLSVRPAIVTTLEESLNEWRDDVGVLPADKLPATPVEKAGGLWERLLSMTAPATLPAARETTGQQSPPPPERRRSPLIALIFPGLATLLALVFVAAIIYALSARSPSTDLAISPPEPAPAPVAAPPGPAQPDAVSGWPNTNTPSAFDWQSLLAILAIAALAGLGAALTRIGAAVAKTATAAIGAARGAFRHAAGGTIRHLAGLTGSLDALRRREIDRLLHLLDVDPDQGLRFALPLTGGGHRGLASPGARLPERKIGFLLSRLGGGGPADHWFTGYDHQLRLQRRYRELAQREMELGRHRRAAYILAELLGDLRSAASALEQGRYFHEAALIYRDKLDEPWAAARCFEHGGDFDEAVRIYVERGELETAGDLLVIIDRAAEAAELYRQAVAKARNAGDYERAARLLEENLHSVDEATETLAAAWPHSAQAGTCLRSLFKLFGRHGRHADASRWVARLKNETAPGRALDLLTDTLPGLATGYPDRTVRAEAADATRALAGARLQLCGHDETERWMIAVRSLVPEDELLGRDTQRWLDRDSRQLTTRKAPRGQVHIAPLNSFRLPGAEWWQTAAACAGGFFAAGYGAAGAVAAWVGWDAQSQFLHWPLPLAELGRPVIASPPDARQATLLAVLGQSRRLEWQTFPALDRKNRAAPARIGTPEWLDDNVLAIACSDTGIYWSIDDRLVLNAVQGGSVALSTRQLSLEELGFHPRDDNDPRETPPLIAARGDRVIIAWGRTLAIVQGHRLTPHDLGGCARRLALTRSPLPLCVAIGFEDHGAELLWLDSATPALTRLADRLPQPELAWTRDGYLVSVYGRDIRVYAAGDRNVVERCRFDCGLNLPVALLPGDAAGEFGILTASGEVKRFRIEG
ncbi:MAG TPA: hypothetical protein VF306_16405, partial [Pirellulales bacterium]